tara:strand:+ start:123 stop:806 length:684 start_codon:yes stop_codon:yes gene_type:complete
MTRYWIPGIDEAYFLTRPEYAKLLGISNNALRMKMRRGFFGEEYVIKNGKYVFKRPSPNIDKRPGDKTDIYQSVKAQNYKYKKSPRKRGTHFENNYTSEALRNHNEFKMYNKITGKLGEKALKEINPELVKLAVDKVEEKRKQARKQNDSFSNWRANTPRRPGMRDRITIDESPPSESMFIGRVPYDPPEKEERIIYVAPEPRKEPEYKPTGRFPKVEEAIRNAKKK